MIWNIKKMDQCINESYYHKPVNIGRQEKLVEQIKDTFFPCVGPYTTSDNTSCLHPILVNNEYD